MEAGGFLHLAAGGLTFPARTLEGAAFAIAWTGLTPIVAYTGDPTWDYVDASFQPVLTS